MIKRYSRKLGGRRNAKTRKTGSLCLAHRGDDLIVDSVLRLGESEASFPNPLLVQAPNSVIEATHTERSVVLLMGGHLDAANVPRSYEPEADRNVAQLDVCPRQQARGVVR